MEFERIKNHPRYEISKNSTIRNYDNKKIKSQYISSTGYYMVSFSYNNKTKPLRVHRLIAEQFIDNPENELFVNHKDGNKINNSIDNLEWCNHSYNMKHAFKNGLINNSGSKNGMAKLKEENIPIIRKLLKDGISQYKIAKQFNVSRSCIMNIKNRNQWTQV